MLYHVIPTFLFSASFLECTADRPTCTGVAFTAPTSDPMPTKGEQTNKRTDRPTDRQADRQTDRQTDRQAFCLGTFPNPPLPPDVSGHGGPTDLCPDTHVTV